MLLGVGGTGRALAQGSVDPTWRFGRLFFPAVSGQWGVGVGGGLSWSRAPRHGPAWIGAALRATARYGITTGSAEGSLIFEAPGAMRDWRVLALARSERMQRTPFFGLANEQRQYDSLKQRYGNLYYRYSLLRVTGLVIVQRRIAGPVWALAGGQVRYYRTEPLTQHPTLFDETVADPAVPDTVRSTGTELRTGLLLDTRDDWAAATRGVLLEAIAAPGTLRAPGGVPRLRYVRWLLGAREFFPLTRNRRTILALRQRLTLASDSLPFYLAYEQTSSWLPYDGVAGPRTMRLHGGGRQLSSNHALATVEVRRKLMVPSDNPDRPGGLWAIIFSDFALLWEPYDRPSLSRKEWTIGTGFRLQFSQGSLTGVDAGWSDSGPHVAILGGFAF